MQQRVLPWSKCTATGTLACFAAASIMGPIRDRGEWGRRTSAICRMMGARSSSAAFSTPRTHSMFATLKEPTAQPPVLASFSRERIFTRDKKTTDLCMRIENR